MSSEGPTNKNYSTQPGCPFVIVVALLATLLLVGTVKGENAPKAWGCQAPNQTWTWWRCNRVYLPEIRVP